MQTQIDEQRAECAHHFLNISESEPTHVGPGGLRERFGRMRGEQPLGPEALTYLQVDSWQDEAYSHWRRARRAELKGKDIEAERHYRQAAALLGAIQILLDAVAERRGGAQCR